MTTYKRGDTVSYRGSGYIAIADPTGTPGVDPAWALFARGVPPGGLANQYLGMSNGFPTWFDLPAQGGGGGGGGGATELFTAHPLADRVDGWAQSADYQAASLDSNGEVLRLISTEAQQFGRWYADGYRIPPPLGLGVIDMTVDMMFESDHASGASAGIVLTDAGDRGQLCFRIDANTDGTLGCRFEYDGVQALESSPTAGDFTFDAWHRLRVVRRGGSAFAYIDGFQVLGTDGGPTDTPNAVTLLMYGGTEPGAVARFGNIFATTSYASGDPNFGPLPTTPSDSTGGGGTTPPEDDDMPKHMVAPSGVTATVAAITNADGQARMLVTFTADQPSTYTDSTAANFDHFVVQRIAFQGDGQREVVFQGQRGGSISFEQPADGANYIFALTAVDEYGMWGVGGNGIVLNMSDGATGNDSPAQGS